MNHRGLGASGDQGEDLVAALGTGSGVVLDQAVEFTVRVGVQPIHVVQDFARLAFEHSAVTVGVEQPQRMPLGDTH